MRQWSGLTLVQVKWLATCSAPSHYLNQCCFIVNWTLGDKLWIHLFGTKPLPEPMLLYCQLDPWGQTLYSRKCTWKYRLRNGGNVVQGGGGGVDCLMTSHNRYKRNKQCEQKNTINIWLFHLLSCWQSQYLYAYFGSSIWQHLIWHDLLLNPALIFTLVVCKIIGWRRGTIVTILQTIHYNLLNINMKIPKPIISYTCQTHQMVDVKHKTVFDSIYGVIHEMRMSLIMIGADYYH